MEVEEEKVRNKLILLKVHRKILAEILVFLFPLKRTLV